MEKVWTSKLYSRIEHSESTEDPFYIFELSQDDYTIGKLLEIYFYKLFESELKFVGFKKAQVSAALDVTGPELNRIY